MNYLITGANRGLGYYLAEAALKQGHQVFATKRSDEGQLTQLQEKYSDQLTIVTFDVQNEEAIKQVAEQLKQENVKLDVIVNNAAILNEREKTIEELDIEKSARALDINVLGPLRVVKHFLPLIEKRDTASIVNISSDSGSLTNAYAGDYPYGISKAALNMFSEKLQAYLKEDGVQILSIHPGWMRTDMGGEAAALNPAESAEKILDLTLQKNRNQSKFTYMDTDGNPMDI
ncbi:NAD(P)-dependent dehydrogenase (short-subunit alcohol dehydrogenase family) [Gracilibacillus halotolerans]|uniref:NAD(P)-dependent dehydrogenase (Short-subunit alcohol dehydrogenase family) n=1 Tax=Gracilibacillus halotolerans TaxID=74386 RepID=A0A841RMF1_9BACI|nr:NAD(P)-dependent dehydrogenase (short-subunit alcohol dehydrogenase family) [Gracilibacillus halotolerans]